MNPTELAHWRYRVKALEPEMRQWEKWDRECRSDARRWPDSAHFKRLAEDAATVLKASKWLLEEARYMSELGAVQSERRRMRAFKFSLVDECRRCHHPAGEHKRVAGFIDPCTEWDCDCDDLDLTGWSDSYGGSGEMQSDGVQVEWKDPLGAPHPNSPGASMYSYAEERWLEPNERKKPPPGTMQGDAGPEYYKHLESRRLTDSGDPS